MKNPAPATSSHAAWWILVLAGLGVIVALILFRVAGSDNPRKAFKAADSANRNRSEKGRAEGATTKSAQAGSMRRGARAPRVDRRRLAEALEQGASAGGPRARTGPDATGSDARRRRGGGDPLDAPGDDPVFQISRNGIQDAIRARIDEVKSCYDGWLTADAALGGGLTVAFRIEAGGEGGLARISNAEVQGSTLDHPWLEQCVLVMLESLQFEAPEGDAVTVRYPFKFSPKE